MAQAMTAPLVTPETFAHAILDARRDARARVWAPWIAHAQRESAPLVRAVRVLALRALGSTETRRTGGSTENSNNHPNSNGHESATRTRGPRIGRSSGDVGQVRGVLAERVIVSTALDPWLSLRALAAYTGLSVRSLRERLLDPTHPLPHYRVGGKVLVRASDYATWALRHRRVGAEDVDRLVSEVLRDLR